VTFAQDDAAPIECIHRLPEEFRSSARTGVDDQRGVAAEGVRRRYAGSPYVR
jgi:hypothetical protein